MVSDSSCSSSDDESRNNKASRKRRRETQRASNDNYRENNRRSDGDRNNKRNQYYKNNVRQERKRRLETPPPRKEDRHGRQRDEEGGSKRPREDNNQNRQRDFRDRRQNKSSFEKGKMKKEPSPEWGRPGVKTEEKPKPQQEKEKPNFGLSGKLTEETNTVHGIVIKYSEPDDAMKPKRRWRLYQFKGEKPLPTLYIHRQSAFLLGRDRKIADIPVDHPSCSKQHAALQYRLVPYKRENGSQGRRVRPYLIDLESANGTFVNDVKLEPRRYHELLERDVIKFGFSSREYVLLHEKSKDEDQDDDVPDGPA